METGDGILRVYGVRPGTGIIYCDRPMRSSVLTTPYGVVGPRSERGTVGRHARACNAPPPRRCTLRSTNAEYALRTQYGVWTGVLERGFWLSAAKRATISV